MQLNTNNAAGAPVFGALSSHSPPAGAPCVCRSTLFVFGVSLQDHWGNRSWPKPVTKQIFLCKY